MAENRKPDSDSGTLMAGAHLQERREVRYSVPLEIEVTGMRDGEVFHERTFTENVSEWGCGFKASFALKKEDMVSIRRCYANPEQAARAPQSLFQLVRVVKLGSGWLFGAWKMDTVKVWGIKLESMRQGEQGNVEQRREEVRAGRARRRDKE